MIQHEKNLTDKNKKEDSGKSYILVNVGFNLLYNILYYLLMGKQLKEPWGEFGYLLAGLFALACTVLPLNLYLFTKKKTNGFLVFIAIIISIILFIFVTKGLVQMK